jgi:hypothetical protein
MPLFVAFCAARKIASSSCTTRIAHVHALYRTFQVKKYVAHDCSDASKRPEKQHDWRFAAAPEGASLAYAPAARDASDVSRNGLEHL